MKTPSLVVLKLPSLAKSPTIGNVNFHSEGQYAFLGKVAFHGNVVVLCKIAFLGKVTAVVIDSIVLVLLLVALASLPLLHPHCRQHHAGIFDLIVMAPVPLLQWCCPPFVALVSAQSRCRSQCMVVPCVCVVVVLVMSCTPSSPCGIVVIIYVNQPGYAKRLVGSKALLALAMHCCRARPHHRTQRHHLFVRALPKIELVVALVVLAHLPLLRWHHCQHCAGVFTLHALASLPPFCWLLPNCNAACHMSSLQSWRFCRRCTGILASIPLAPLPALRWHHCPRCAGITASIGLASLPSTHWHCCLCRAGIIALVTLASAHWQCCSQHIVIAELASLPALRWHPCKHCSDVVTVAALASTPLLRWRLRPCAGTTASTALALFPLRWRHRPCCAGVCLIVTLQHFVVTELVFLPVLH